MAPSSRDRVRQMQQQQRAAAQRRRRVAVALVVVVVLAVVVGVGIAVQMSRSEVSGGAVSGDAVPSGVVDRYAVPRGDRSAPVTLTLYEDFQCPVCRQVEAIIGPTVDRYVENGTVRVEYRPIAFLDAASTTEYSSRALNAAACVLDERGTDAFVRMHDLLFADQPPEGTDGLSDAQLTALAARAGAGRETVAGCIDDQRFASWAAAATEQASKDGVNATPTILVDGKQLRLSGQESPATTLREAVRAAS
jgi:protein-disulfide isomerase